MFKGAGKKAEFSDEAGPGPCPNDQVRSAGPSFANMQARVEPALRIAMESSQSPAVKLRVIEALLWMHLPMQPTLTPNLLRGVVHTASAASLVPGCAHKRLCSRLVRVHRHAVFLRVICSALVIRPLLYLVYRPEHTHVAQVGCSCLQAHYKACIMSMS